MFVLYRAIAILVLIIYFMNISSVCGESRKSLEKNVDFVWLRSVPKSNTLIKRFNVKHATIFHVPNLLLNCPAGQRWQEGSCKEINYQ